MAFKRNVRAQGARRKTAWFFGTARFDTVAPGTPILLTSLNAAALALRPFTVVRTYAELFLGSDQEAADESQVGAYGHIVVSDQASAAGVGSVPTPISEMNSDWFLYQQMVNSFRLGTAVGFDGNDGQAFSVSSKAMRKVELGQDIVSVVELAPGVSAGGDVISISRMLVKLH